MVGKRLTAALLTSLALFCGDCASLRDETVGSVRDEISGLRKRIIQNRTYMLKVRDFTVGGSGFFYVVDTDGQILAHPKEYLIGTSFRENKFIRGVIKRRSGCFRYSVGSIEYAVFYEPLSGNEILCLSIQADEVKGVAACPEMKE